MGERAQLDQRSTDLAPPGREPWPRPRRRSTSGTSSCSSRCSRPLPAPASRATARSWRVSMKTGKVAWSHSLAPGSESSPLVHGLSVFLGDQGGTVYSFRTYDGHLNWTFRASGAVKGGVAFAHNTIYFGDYGARVHAVNAANGREIWSAAGGGSFYSTPAVAFGRVYIGSTSGAVYAFWASSGATFVDRVDGRLRLRLAGGRRRSRSRADGVHRLLRRPLCTPTAPTPAACGGVTQAGAGSTARRPSWATSSTTPGSARTPPPA